MMDVRRVERRVEERRGFKFSGSWRMAFEDLNLDFEGTMKRAGLGGLTLVGEQIWLTTEEYIRIWKTLEEDTGDDLLALHLLSVGRSDHFYPPIFGALCSANLGKALERIATYKRLFSMLEMTIEEELDQTRVTLHWPVHESELPFCLQIFEQVFFVMFARMATQANVVPLSVTIMSDRQAPEEYENFFGVAPVRGTESGLIFAKDDIQRGFVTANEAMWELFEPSLKRRLQDLTREATMAEQVHSALLEALPAGQASVAEIARKLCVSTRTLQRRLRDEQTSYQEVLDRTRGRLAAHYLRQDDLSIGEIAYLLGFEQSNSFTRAYRRWTGKTPEAARREA